MGDSPERAALAVFRQAADTVPAYAAFLREHGVDPAGVTALSDVPVMSKDGYVRRYPLAERCRGGVVGDMIAVSSGSTGEPAFWPRSAEDERLVADRFELVFRDAFRAHERPTLAVVCFALGTWVGGLYTVGCLRELAGRGIRISVVAPGSDRDEIVRVVTALAPQFEQTVLLGYPPFLKDVIDSGGDVPWGDFDLKLVTAGEVFSEEWRSLVARRAGIGDPVRSTASLYGTADAGVLGTETPLSIEIRRLLAERPEAARELFGESRLPTLVQYDPYARYFEEADGRLMFTGDSGVPLVRYDIADEGGLVPYERMAGFLDAHGLTVKSDGPRLPFVYVFGRSHFTVSFYGANVYPENITVGLEQRGIAEAVTGKFVLEVIEDDERDRHLSVTVEQAPDAVPDPALANRVAAAIVTQLRRLNSEFAHYVPEPRQRPLVRVRAFADPDYFPPGVKHRYTRGPSA
ncbi:phenylacetate--CoA ligase family protein [Spirillospora sp. NPDC047279]|uniref:phenylacetate--CoA ligase family protein n=1 Tax=Spirillospora sp. NPDC047279 TaxID=3155478 RepID=UPI0033D04298